MPWNDQSFRDAVERAVATCGKSRSAALKEAGLSTETFNHPPEFGRRTDVFERLMPVLGWSPADVLRIIAEGFGWEVAVGERGLDDGGEVRVFLRNVEIRVVTLGHPAKGRSESD